MAIFQRVISSLPVWLTSPKSRQDGLKIAGVCAAGFTTIYIGNILRFKFKESKYPYNWGTTAEEVIQRSSIDFSNKVAIITGANSGIGKESAKQLYGAGCIVIMACRNIKKANEARGDILRDKPTQNANNLIFIRLDLADLKSIDEFVTNFNQNDIVNGKLNYLINNAGIMGYPKFGVTMDGLDEQFGINHMGHFYLTNKLLAIIKQNKTRIINLSSLGHSLYCNADIMRTFLNGAKSINPPRGPSPEFVEYTPYGYYGISKTSNVLFTRHLNKLYNKDGIVSVVVHPGAVMTNLDNNAAVEISGVIQVLLFHLPFIKWPERGASSTLRAVTISDEEIFNGNMDDIENMSLYFMDTRPQNNGIQKDFRNYKNTDIDEELWEYSKRIICSYAYLKLNE